MFSQVFQCLTFSLFFIFSRKERYCLVDVQYKVLLSCPFIILD